jgi:hypothetical protein
MAQSGNSSLSPRKLGLDPRRVHLESMVKNMPLGQEYHVLVTNTLLYGSRWLVGWLVGWLVK